MPHPPQPSRRPRQRLVLSVVAALAALLATLAPTAGEPAQAATVGVLCSGFDACNSAGMSASGYHTVWNTMFWNMYSGRNCTNYVAYRMIQAGMSSTRPSQLKPGLGNASYWGPSFGTLTNSTPKVGAVAWWKANVPGAGSGGHVAYVEKVYSATDIVISESNWSGDFDWRRITTAANWPSGFIHLHDSGTPATIPTPTPTPAPSASPTTGPTQAPVTAPVLRSAPTITGTVAVGETIAATPGTWAQTGLTYAYQWYADGAPLLTGGTGSTFTLTKNQLGKRISVKVTATNSVGSTPAASASTAAVIAGTIAVTAPPQITGDPRIDETVTAVPPVTNRPLVTTDVQWYADDEPIPGATGWSLTLGADEVAHRLTVQVHGTRVAFNDVTVASPPAGPVTAPRLEVATAAAVTGDPYVGSVLTATPAVTTPASTATSFAWLRDGQAIPGATAATYRLTPADAGHHLSVQVDQGVTGYYPMSQTLTYAPAITFPVVLAAGTSSADRSADVTVKVRSLGQQLAVGRVTVVVGKRRVTVRLHGKPVTVHLDGLPLGRRPLKIRYDGPPRYQTVVQTGHMRVRR